MTSIVDLVVEDPRWGDLPLEILSDTAANAALTAAGIATRDVEISLLACDDARIASLNSAFRGKSSATNVLSWPALDLFPRQPGSAPSTEIPPDPTGHVPLGDVAIAYDTVMAEAQAGNIPPDHHVVHLILHACLHLLGYDHVLDEDADIMERLEVQALATMGIPSPY